MKKIWNKAAKSSEKREESRKNEQDEKEKQKRKIGIYYKKNNKKDIKKYNEKNSGKKCSIYKSYIKRPLDFVCVLIALIFLSPLMLIISVLVRVKLGSPVIFTQERPGLHEKIFKLYKFRSMSDARGEDGKLLPDAERLGHFGKMLRATSLDELPELINILKGDMSIVGPRPLLVEYLPRYSKRQHKRHSVRPGLTGYAQVNGRNAISWEERFEKDVWYVEHVSFVWDLKIILQTILAVLKQKGISSENCATMEEFQGDKKAGKKDIKE